MDVDSEPTMEETILVGDDLMMGPPSPLIPPEIASHVLEGIDLCDGILRNLFLCLQINDIEPFCQDEIALYRQCAEKRDKELRQRLQDSECKLGFSMPLDEAKERAAQLQAEITSLERRLILASGIQGMEGFRQRWSLHGRLEDTNTLSRRFLLTIGSQEHIRPSSLFSSNLCLFVSHSNITIHRKRLESLDQGMSKRQKENVGDSNRSRRWFFW